MSAQQGAKGAARAKYTHAVVRDRYDADLLMAGFEDGAEWGFAAGVRAAREAVEAVRKAMLELTRDDSKSVTVRQVSDHAAAGCAELIKAIDGRQP